MSSAYVERRFQSARGEVLAHFETPYLAPSGEFRCRWRISWPDCEHSREAAGIDGIQSLMLAMQTVRMELVESELYRAGNLTYLDQSDLDLPPSWGIGPLYDDGPPARNANGC